MDFVGGLGNEKQAAADQDDVAPGERIMIGGENITGQSNQPYEKAEQHDTEQERESEADLARAPCLFFRDNGDDNRNENDVVDTENDLERRQRQQGSPGFRARQEFHHAWSDLTSRIALSLATM